MRWRCEVGLAALLAGAPAFAGAETFGFVVKRDIAGKVTCERDQTVKDPTPDDAVVVKLKRLADVAQAVLLSSDPGSGGPVTELPSEPGATATEISFKVLKKMLKPGITLVLRDPGESFLKCPAVPLTPPQDDEGPVRTGPVDLGAVDWWQKNGAAKIRDLVALNTYPPETQFLVHYETGEPAPPFPASVSEQAPVQVVVVARKGVDLTLSLSVTSCASLQPFRIREKQPGEPQAARVGEAYQLVAYGPLLRCGAGALSYSLDVNGAAHLQTIRIRPVYHLAFAAAYGFDFTSVPSYSVEAGKVAQTSDRAGLGLRLGLTWFPLGIDYEDMKWWNYANPVFAFDPKTPTENFMVGLALTPTGGFAVLVGSNFQRIPVPSGVAVGGDITGSEVPTTKAWNRSGIGLFLGLSVDDNVFGAIKGRMGQ